MLILGCSREPADQPTNTLFTLLPAQQTGIDFVNRITYTEAYNPYTFRNFFNGGGVGMGDINNDGLIDLFFCGNLENNRLYLNKGNFQFEDITDKAGVASPGVWTSGVSMADVNGDGWLDIYLCKSGDPSGENRHNELFINNGDLTFTERAAEYGIDDLGLSTHAAFFDYDRDGDLDCYLLNNSLRPVGGYDLRKDQREIRDLEGGNKLYRNDMVRGGVGERETGSSGDSQLTPSPSPPLSLSPFFTDVSEEANIYGSNIGFGLGVTIGDLNRDGWPDIYVSNDFFERDYLYINNQDGTFREVVEEQIQELSFSSMGADMADINNDGYAEIFVTDMLPEGDARMKTKTNFENWDKYQLNLQNGYHRQFNRNVLQLNNRNGSFSEIGRLAGVYATDWSWGALMMDMDNDGLKDIFVANGIFKDLTDQDYINFYSDPSTVRDIMNRKENVITELIDAIPSEPVPNYAFHNQGTLRFVNRAAEWGLGQPSFSNGSAYGDLDNDGDLDLVTNNVNMPPFIYRNEAEKLLSGKSNYLTVELRGTGKNQFAIGAGVTLKHAGRTYFQELFPMRGFQSTVDPRLHFGLGELEQVDSLLVGWPDGTFTVLTDIVVNQHLVLEQEKVPLTSNPPAPTNPTSHLFSKTSVPVLSDFRHDENEFVDFDRERLLYHMKSADGPCLARADVNGDGMEDVFIGGAKDQPGALFLQQAGGSFRRVQETLFEEDRLSEDTDALFFDADGDGDADLYVCSGGNEFPSSSSALRDRLYRNDGRGNFSKMDQMLPTLRFVSSSCVDAADYDGDGDLDLFVGERLRPFLYGVPTSGFILENDGDGNFREITEQAAPTLQEYGLITDAKWTDYDQDGDPDLIVVGEWLPVSVFRNDDGQLVEVTASAALKESNGFWNTLEVADLNGDSYPDLILGNHGQNTRFKASRDKPVTMYVNDFDRNGSAEQIITVFNGEEAYPLALLQDLVKQMPGLRKKYLKYESYREQTITDIFSPGELEKAIVREVHETRSSVALNQGDGRFSLIPLPVEAQLAPVYGIAVDDFDGDDRQDILLGGNFYRAKPEVGIYASSYGAFLKGDGRGGFAAVPAGQSGFMVEGAVRDIQWLNNGNKRLILVAKNDDFLEVFEF